MNGSIIINLIKKLSLYSEDEIGLCITTLETFISEEPGLVAPLLPEILLSVSRIARNPQYSWEMDSSSFIPSNCRSIARQVRTNYRSFLIKLMRKKDVEEL